MREHRTEQEVLDAIHKALKARFWPEHLTMGESYGVKADDVDHHRGETGWFTITIVDTDTITVETIVQEPDNTTLERKDIPYRATVSKARNPLTFRAMLYLALAFRLDNIQPLEKRKAALTKQRTLREIYRLLNNLLWPTTLKVNHYYALGQDGAGVVGAYHTELNDSHLVVGNSTARNTSGRFRDYFGGGNKLYTYYALRILAEAIRLETEGGDQA